MKGKKAAPPLMPALPIRRAKSDDLAEITRVLLVGHAENGEYEINHEKLRGEILGALNGTGLIAVIGPPDNIFAILWLVIEDVYYSDEVKLVERLNYVRPDARRSDYAKRMIEYAKILADELGLKLVIGVMSDIRMEAKVRLYRRQLPKAGEFFVYRPTMCSIAAE